MSRFSKAQFYKNLKKENWKRLAESVYGDVEQTTEFPNTDINMEQDFAMPEMQDTSVQFEEEISTTTHTEKQTADCEYVNVVIDGIKADLDEISSKIGQIQMTEDETTGVVSYNYLFDNHEIVNTILSVANSVSASLTQIKTALSTQTPEEQQQSVVDDVVDNWGSEQSPDTAEDVVIVTDEVGDNFGQDDEDEGWIIDSILFER